MRTDPVLESLKELERELIDLGLNAVQRERIFTLAADVAQEAIGQLERGVGDLLKRYGYGT